jgi:hypothetical protein
MPALDVFLAPDRIEAGAIDPALGEGAERDAAAGVVLIS